MDNNGTNIILFDGVCNLCNKTVQFIIQKDPIKNFRFASLQSKSGQLLFEQLGVHSESVDSLIYIKDGKFYVKSTAVLMILRRLSNGWKFFYCFIIIPRFLRDWAYDIIAKRRYRFFGKSEFCITPAPEYQERFLE